jgi:hypothetical protein
MKYEKVRFWLVRRLLGTDKIDKAIGKTQNALYTNCLAYMADRLAQDSQRYAEEYATKLIGEFTPELLASAVEANSALTEQQKTAIISILASPKTVASYLQ